MLTPQPVSPYERYGPASVFAAAVNVFLGTTIAWVSCPFLIFYLYFGPMLAIDVVAAVVLISLNGLARQVGRGLGIGLISVPLSTATVWTSYLIA
ncbi:hypothetical protein FHT40_006146 [Mycolicibacterium sp. BK556]|uniref:hypothetical protein n=1 Tax=unclassified Mycolicibacterium TaxID=2636767 RepID=UPI00161449D2|nr:MULTISPECIES: hypothetical protein [unclassified Mycolicibacterium]MBB3606455.1 hypothetical protein [Mycolicibacterium sp. BK556]MBB3636299.1 hypothetical protein [Mycolicibacterium sp. BK607]